VLGPCLVAKMADAWDPFAIEEEPAEVKKAPAAEAAAAPEAPKEQETVYFVSDDCARHITAQVVQKFDDMPYKPWLDYEMGATPDLSLHTPSCSIEDWSHKDVELKIGKGIAYIIFNRADANNSITETVYQGYNDAIHALHKRTDIRVVVITAKGKMFSSGLDPSWDSIPTKQRSPEALKAADEFIERAMKTGIFANKEEAGVLPYCKQHYNFCLLPQLTIGIVNGSVMGQGLGYICSCDVVMSVKSAFWTLSDVKMGLVPSLMAPYLLLKCRPDAAKKMMMLGETFDTETAYEKGFVNYIVEDMDDAQKVLKTICERVSTLSPEDLNLAKRLTYAVSGRPVTEGIMWHSLITLNKSRWGNMEGKGDAKPWQDSKIEVLEPAPW